MNFRLDIQGLRALAVILVIIFHINEKWLPGGFVGVDVFFVISGFLISKSIIQQKDEGSFEIVKFFEGRLKRILPAYYFALIFILIVAVFLLIPSDFLTLFHQIKRTLVFFSNHLFAQTENYFGAKSFENPLLHTWSLSIEMQFYILMPIFIVVLPKKYRLALLLLIFSLLLAYTQYGLSVLDQKNQMYFSLSARSLEFLIGILLNFTKSSTLFSKKLLNIISSCGLLLIISSAFILDKHSLFPGLLSMPACIGTALIIWVSNSSTNTLFSTPALVRIGDYSYSLYLWHWPVLAFFRYYTMNYELSIVNLVLAVLVFITLSIISFHIIEERIRKKKSWNLYVSLILLTLFLGLVWFFGKQYNENQLKDVTEFITPKSDSNHHQYQGYKLFGDTSIPDQRILIIGDSHCQSMLPFFGSILFIMGKYKNIIFVYAKFSRNIFHSIRFSRALVC